MIKSLQELSLCRLEMWAIKFARCQSISDLGRPAAPDLIGGVANPLPLGAVFAETRRGSGARHEAKARPPPVQIRKERGEWATGRRLDPPPAALGRTAPPERGIMTVCRRRSDSANEPWTRRSFAPLLSPPMFSRKCTQEFI
jgi:hypothetical protein